MKRFPTLALLVVLRLQAGTIDVSSAQSVTVRTGESLSFELFTSSYAANAQRLDLPLNPVALQFALITAETDSTSQFAASLSSPDASTTIALESLLTFLPGYYSSAGYQGAVSTLKSQVQFDPQVSQDLFRAGVIRLRLTNLGGEVYFGLTPLRLSQDLYGSLSGGPLSVGAITGPVTLETLGTLRSAHGFAVAAVPVAGAPEPATGGLAFAAGAVLVALSAQASRTSRTGR